MKSDDPSLTRDWPARSSLTVQVRPGTAPHPLYWFNECGRAEGHASASYLIEGAVTFEDLQVMGPDEVPERLECVHRGRAGSSCRPQRARALSVSGPRCEREADTARSSLDSALAVQPNPQVLDGGVGRLDQLQDRRLDLGDPVQS